MKLAKSVFGFEGYFGQTTNDDVTSFTAKKNVAQEKFMITSPPVQLNITETKKSHRLIGFDNGGLL